MSRMDELDMPKLLVAALLAVVGLGVGLMAWLSMPENTDGLVQLFIWIFVLASLGPVLSVYFNWQAGLGLSVVVALGSLIGMQLVVKKPGVSLPRAGMVMSVMLTCAEGGVVTSVIGPQGTRLVFNNPNTLETFPIGEVHEGNRLNMLALTATAQAKLHTCKDKQGRGLLANYILEE